jgi:hypothetical protein
MASFDTDRDPWWPNNDRFIMSKGMLPHCFTQYWLAGYFPGGSVGAYGRSAAQCRDTQFRACFPAWRLRLVRWGRDFRLGSVMCWVVA